MADAVAAAQALVARHTAELAAANLQLRRARTMAQRRAAERAVAAAQSALQAAQKQLTDAQAAAAAVAVKTGGLTRVLTVGINYTGTPYELAGCNHRLPIERKAEA